MMTAARSRALRILARRVADLRGETARVAIDGVTAAGKTTLADELAGLLRPEALVERISLDDYHRPAEERHRCGRDSPEGYYLDSFDYTWFINALAHRDITGGTIVLVDGVFLLRPELNALWSYRVFIDVDADVAYERGIARDASWMGGEDEARRLYQLRYIPGERLYLDAVRPASLADAVLENTDPARPRLRFNS